MHPGPGRWQGEAPPISCGRRMTRALFVASGCHGNRGGAATRGRAPGARRVGGGGPALREAPTSCVPPPTPAAPDAPARGRGGGNGLVCSRAALGPVPRLASTPAPQFRASWWGGPDMPSSGLLPGPEAQGHAWRPGRPSPPCSPTEGRPLPGPGFQSWGKPGPAKVLGRSGGAGSCPRCAVGSALPALPSASTSPKPRSWIPMFWTSSLAPCRGTQHHLLAREPQMEALRGPYPGSGQPP